MHECLDVLSDVSLPLARLNEIPVNMETLLGTLPDSCITNLPTVQELSAGRPPTAVHRDTDNIQYLSGEGNTVQVLRLHAYKNAFINRPLQTRFNKHALISTFTIRVTIYTLFENYIVFLLLKN